LKEFQSAYRIDSLVRRSARRFRTAAVWRHSGPISDLCRWRDATPDAPAIKAYLADGRSLVISYAEYSRHVERFAGALYELGVRPGQVVACQLANWWQAQALLLAATRLEAVVAPIMTEWYLPTRLEYVEALPRNDNGKVRKELLRRWLVGQASLTSK
jgi:acyl-coenzyme A synthetase/AMP-(fatty) acid ligase